MIFAKKERKLFTIVERKLYIEDSRSWARQQKVEIVQSPVQPEV